MDRPCKYDGVGPGSRAQDFGPFSRSEDEVVSAIQNLYTQIPDSAAKMEPEPRPVCRMFDLCEGCPYPAHGFICWGPDEGCLRSEMQKICTPKEEIGPNSTWGLIFNTINRNTPFVLLISLEEKFRPNFFKDLSDSLEGTNCFQRTRKKHTI